MTKPRQNFPNWLRRIDPTLSAEDTNPIFQAFQDRRLYHHRKGIGDQLLRNNIYITLRNITLALLAVIVITFFSYQYFIFGYILAFALVPVFFRFFQEVQTKDYRLPYYVHNVISTNGIIDPIAFELWKTGITGRDLIEAIYLEKRAVERLWFLWIHLLTTIMIVSVYLSYRGVQSLTEIIFVLTFLWFSWEVFKEIQLRRSERIMKTDLQLIYTHLISTRWKFRYMSSFQAGIKRAFILAFALPFFFCCVFLIYFFFAIMIESLDILPINIPLFIPDGSYLTEWIFVFVLAMIAWFFRKDHKLMQSVLGRLFENDLKRGTDAFSYYISTAIIKDPDARQ